MNVLITGAAGFLGSRLAHRLLTRGALLGRELRAVSLLDQAEPPASLMRDPRVEVRVGPLAKLCAGKELAQADAIFHLASAVSLECERDFDLGMSSNLDGTRFLLEGLRRADRGGRPVPRLVFSSSGAVFGSTRWRPLPDIVDDDTLPVPQTSYGTQKLMCEHLVADYSRKGFVDGRSARLMTVVVRAGEPNGAASSFFSSIIREPLAGRGAVCPVSLETLHPVCSATSVIEGLIQVMETGLDALGGRTAVNLPALNLRVSDMLDALEAVAGPRTRNLVRIEPDGRIAAIVAGWPRALAASRAARIGLQADTSFERIIEEFIADRRAAGDEAALAALLD